MTTFHPIPNCRQSPRPKTLRILVVAALLVFPSLAIVPSASADVIVASEFMGTLQEAINAAGQHGMLIVDQTYLLDAPIVLPRYFRMVGTGPLGQGVLAFTIDTGSAITIDGAGDAFVTIENLDIEGLYTPDGGFSTTARGLDLSGSHNVYVRNVTVRGFDVGIYGRVSFSVHVRDSNVSVNQTHNYHLRSEAHSWRIAGGLSSLAGRSAIQVEESNNVVIDSVRLESNPIGVYTNTESTHLLHNRFECSPVIPVFCDGEPVAVRIGPQAHGTTLLSNYYSGYEPLEDLSTDGQTYRFDNQFGATIRPDAGDDGLRVELPDPDHRLVFDDDGRLRVGPVSGVTARLTVNAAVEEALRVRVDGITRLFVGSDGEVGVGTAAPTEQLHVGGNLRLEGNLISDGALCIGSGC